MSMSAILVLLIQELGVAGTLRGDSSQQCSRAVAYIFCPAALRDRGLVGQRQACSHSHSRTVQREGCIRAILILGKSLVGFTWCQ